MSMAPSMLDRKPILPPYPGMGGLANGYQGLNNGLGQLPEHSTANPMFLSSFAAAQRGRFW